ncbi:MAG: universal stress protein [Bacteroidota bacterium]|nr:universal stress protein [Bacteroidota bacterium]
MAQYNNPIIVPWDFSELAEYAFLHALNLAKAFRYDIVLANIVKRDADIDASKEKLEKIATKYESEYGIRPYTTVQSGSIFSVISELISETKASFAVMGTHGIKGMQKFTGSWALKVIIGSQAPFIVVQGPPKKTDKFENIVFPIDFKFSSKEKLAWAQFMSKQYDSVFHLCYNTSSDPGFRKKINANITLAQNFLTERGVNYEIINLKGNNLSADAVAYAKKIDAGMIMIATTKNISFQDYVLGASEQKIIANIEKIPVMCVNPKKGLTKTGHASLVK